MRMSFRSETMCIKSNSTIAIPRLATVIDTPSFCKMPSRKCRNTSSTGMNSSCTSGFLLCLSHIDPACRQPGCGVRTAIAVSFGLSYGVYERAGNSGIRESAQEDEGDEPGWQYRSNGRSMGSYQSVCHSFEPMRRRILMASIRRFVRWFRIYQGLSRRCCTLAISFVPRIESLCGQFLRRRGNPKVSIHLSLKPHLDSDSRTIGVTTPVCVCGGS